MAYKELEAGSGALVDARLSSGVGVYLLDKQQVILVVEDEPLLRLAAIDMVEDAGFTAVEAGNAMQAVRILEDRPDIRIVFTDIDMPGGMDGMTLAAAIRRRWPPIDIVLTSGYLEADDVDLPTRGLFFSKPYNEDDVVAAFRQLAN